MSRIRLFFKLRDVCILLILLFLLYFRNILGTKTLSELLSERDTIAKDLKSMIDTATDPWGIDVRI